jgi:hypothetical protein
MDVQQPPTHIIKCVPFVITLKTAQANGQTTDKSGFDDGRAKAWCEVRSVLAGLWIGAAINL